MGRISTALMIAALLATAGCPGSGQRPSPAAEEKTAMGASKCARDADCPGAAPLCLAGACVACRADGDCPGGRACVRNACGDTTVIGGPGRVPGTVESRPVPDDADGPRACFLETIHFGFDEATLDDEARQTLQRSADCVRERKLAAVTIEGHCDERGTAEYNLDLGLRRAAAARRYLATLGVNAPIHAKTFGLLLPADPSHGEEAWRKNRRAEFRAPGEKLSDGKSVADGG